jgi:hypothetical protein
MVVAAMTVPATAAVRTDIITVAPAAIRTAKIAIIVGAVAIPAVIGNATATALNRTAGRNDHKEAGKSGGR